jgi:hypothetical protein
MHQGNRVSKLLLSIDERCKGNNFCFVLKEAHDIISKINI